VKRGVPELDTEFKLAQLITISKHQANKENHIKFLIVRLLMRI